MATSTLLIRTGCVFKMVCGDCGKVIAKNLASERAAACNAGLAVHHQTECPGQKLSRFRYLLRRLALS
jgi:hypothetical protein